MTGHEVELDIAHEHAGRQVSALLSAALTAAQSAAQISAGRARQREAAAEAQARAAQRATDQLSRAEQQAQRRSDQVAALAQRQAERQARTEESLQHKQWGLKPDAQWLEDNPLSAASAWASADTHRHTDPIAARHAEQWEAVFAKAGIDLDEVRANAAAGTAQNRTEADSMATDATGDLAAAEVAVAAAAAGATDVAHQFAHEQMLQRLADRFHAAPDLEGQLAATQAYAQQMTKQFGAGWSARADLPEAQQAAQHWQQLTATAPASAATAAAPSVSTPTPATPAPTGPPPSQPTTTVTAETTLPAYSAYAGGDPVAILGGRGFSKPPSEILAAAKAKPDVASLLAAANTRSVQAEPVAAGIER